MWQGPLTKTVLVLLTLTVIVYPMVGAQATWISGYVKDLGGKPIAGATIKARGVFETSTISDSNGYYKLGLSAGEWIIIVSYDAFEESKTIALADGEHKAVDFTIGTYVTVHSTTGTATFTEVTFTGATITYGGTTITTVVNTSPSDLFYWWMFVIGLVVILGIVLALATKKRTKPSPEARIEPLRKEVMPTELPTIIEKEKEGVRKGTVCSACGYSNPPYAVNYCVNCGARLK